MEYRCSRIDEKTSGGDYEMPNPWRDVSSPQELNDTLMITNCPYDPNETNVGSGSPTSSPTNQHLWSFRPQARKVARQMT